MNKFVNYVFDLGFRTAVMPELPQGAMGKVLATLRIQWIRTTEDLVWDVLCWLSLGVGVLSRQAVVISSGGLNFDLSRITRGSLIASGCIALAAFGPFMRWLNKKKTNRGLLHIALPYGFGFFAVQGVQVAGRILRFFS